MFRLQLALAVLTLTSTCKLQSAVLTPEQAIKVHGISELSFSPDGSWLSCTVSEVPKGPTPESHIWMLDARSSEFRQFTFGPKSERSPQWSPDGRTLAFASDRNERMQVYVIRMDGGEANQLTSGTNAVSEFRWAPDGKQIAFLAPEPKTPGEEKKATDKDDGKVADEERDLPRLWIVDLASKQVKQITRGAWRIDDFEWLSADRLMVVAGDQPRSETWHNALYRIDLATGTFTAALQPNQPFGGLTISKGRSLIAFSGARTAGPTPHDLFMLAAGEGTQHDVTEKLDRPVRGVKWQDDANAVVSVADGFESKLYRVSVAGKPEPIHTPFPTGDFDMARDGTLAFVAEGFDRLPELYLQAAKGAAPKQVSRLNETWAGIKLANAQVFKFRSFDGIEVEAALMKPSASEGKAKQRPLILLVHGGPAGAFSASYSSWPQLLAAHGFQVLMINPRGSSGYGEDFLKANRADWGGRDFKDLMAGVDAVIARGETDTERLGIGGWSYGGYMAEWAVTQTNRFKAAVSGAGMFDLAAEFETEAGPAYDEWYFTTPWEHPEKFARSSPMTFVKHARTPTLILQGENDSIDPPGQSTALYRALKRYGVETELVLYPREPHGFKEEKHQVDVLNRMLGWFTRYLKPET